jgi:uncharacterized protein YaaQ
VLEDGQVDRLLVVFVVGSQSELLMDKLRELNFRFTQVDSRGGFLQEKTTCIFIGLENARLNQALELIRSCCPRHLQYIPARMDVATSMQGQPLMLEAEVGGANIIVLGVEKFIQLG